MINFTPNPTQKHSTQYLKWSNMNDCYDFHLLFSGDLFSHISLSTPLSPNTLNLGHLHSSSHLFPSADSRHIVLRATPRPQLAWPNLRHLRRSIIWALERTKVAQDQPSWKDGKCPEPKIHVDAAELGKDCHGFEAISNRLPGRLGSTKQGGITDHLCLVVGEIVDDEVAKWHS